MVRILVVEDDATKAGRLIGVISEVPGVAESDVEHEVAAAGAISRMADRVFDLLVLDLVVPGRLGEQPSKDGGIRVIDAIEENNRLKKPRHILVVTASKADYDAVSARFSSRHLTLTHYDPTSDGWVEPLRSRVEHIVASSLPHAKEFGADLAIVCAVDVEMDALRRLPWHWESHPVLGDHALYLKGVFQARGQLRTCFATQSPRMGMTAAAVCAAKIVSAFRPRYLGMCGIAAGVSGKVRAGDVVVPTVCWDSGSGKWIAEATGVPRFLLAPHQLSLDVSVREAFLRLKDDRVALNELKETWPADKPSHAISIELGPFASGAAVLADGKSIPAIVAQNRQLVGVDMETYAILNVADESCEPRPTAVVAKAVVDFGEPDKDDAVQRYAAYVSANCLRLVAERWLRYE